jgi:hypothetical protein
MARNPGGFAIAAAPLVVALLAAGPALPQQQRDGPDRSQGAKRGPHSDPVHLGAGREPRELRFHEVQFV